MSLSEQPGLLFVIATLLPLASFVALLLLGATRWFLRGYAKDSPGVDSAYQFLGGAVPGVGPAYCALAAIVLAFICCAVGFALFVSEVGEMHELEHKLFHAHAKHDDHGKGKDQHDDHDHGKEKGKHDDHEKKKDDHANHGKQEEKDVAKSEKEAKEQREKDRGRYNELVHHWEGSIVWARVNSSSVPDSDRASILTLGFRID
ncbi:MAG TPA: hypothetical protein VFE62_21600, partial [Gemmataceae bacterium]|nr:hypothetical protein [Gemmataceae bacterium]